MRINTLVNLFTCKHEYMKYSDFCYHDIPTNRNYVEITLICTKCGKKKDLDKFYIPESMEGGN